MKKMHLHASGFLLQNVLHLWNFSSQFFINSSLFMLKISTAPLAFKLTREGYGFYWF